MVINRNLFSFPRFDQDPGAPKHKRVAGTVYPATGMRGDADNAVLLPEFVDSSLRIKTVRYVYVEAADQTASAYTFLTVGMADTFTGDQIQWQENRPLEFHRRSHIALENGHWAVRDGFGTIYDFH